MLFFFFNDTAPTEISTLPLHDALPICRASSARLRSVTSWPTFRKPRSPPLPFSRSALVVPSMKTRERSEEHTSELQSRQYLVCRLLLEKKKTHHLRPSSHDTTVDKACV